MAVAEPRILARRRAMMNNGVGKAADASVTWSVNARLPDRPSWTTAPPKPPWPPSARLSKETGPHGIRINTVSPGPVATDLWLGAKGGPCCLIQ